MKKTILRFSLISVALLIIACEKIDAPIIDSALGEATETALLATDSLYKFQDIVVPVIVNDNKYLKEIYSVDYYYTPEELYQRVAPSCNLDDLGIDTETFSSIMNVIYSADYYNMIASMFINSGTGAKGRFEEYHFKYNSTAADGKPITLSGVAILPNYATDGIFKHTLDAFTLSHDHLKGLNDYASRLGTMEFLRVMYNQIVVLSDFEGYNISRDNMHPYLCYNELARQSIDCALAALELLDEIGVNMKKDYKTYNMGMSKGSPVAIATQRMIENTEPKEVKEKLNLAGTYSATGPYDLKEYMKYYNEKYLKGDTTLDEIAQACYVATVAIYCAYISHKDKFDTIGVGFNDFFSDDFIPDNFDLYSIYKSTNNSMSNILEDQVNNYANQHGDVSLGKILNERFFIKDGEHMGEFNTADSLTNTLFEAMDEENPTLGWNPKSLLLFEHSSDDNFTPYELSINSYYDLKYGEGKTPNAFVNFNTYYGLDHNTMSGLGIVRMSLLKNPAAAMTFNIFN